MEGGQAAEQERVPLSAVVSECINWWFEDMLMEAKTGDINMQVLVGQMYYCGYGIPRDANKGRIWITRASRVRSWVWKVSNKRPRMQVIQILMILDLMQSLLSYLFGASSNI